MSIKSWVVNLLSTKTIKSNIHKNGLEIPSFSLMTLLVSQDYPVLSTNVIRRGYYPYYMGSLTLVPAHESKSISKKSGELWNKTKDLIRSITNKPDNYNGNIWKSNLIQMIIYF